MAEYIEKHKVVNLLTALENECQQFKPFEGFEHAMSVIAIIFVVIAFTYEPIFAAPFALTCLLAIILLSNGIPDYIAWKTVPETTANQYIVEHYGGGQYDD